MVLGKLELFTLFNTTAATATCPVYGSPLASPYTSLANKFKLLELEDELELDLIKYMILTPMLISAFVIDYRLQIIPNRLNLTIFETGLIFTFIQGLYNPQLAWSLIQGGLIGAGIFLVITLIGGLIAGKEAMGFGDVKFMGAIGLFFGNMNIVAISVIAFLLAAVISIILIVTKVKKTDEYIPFGPFIVMASFIVMIVPFEMLLFVLLKIFTLGMYQGTYVK